MTDYLDILFTDDEAVIEANKAERAAMRCPRCMGEGRISQFQHRKGGECFLCGGSGVFAGYKG